MQFLIVQGGLRDRSDHFYNETIGWLQACASRDVPVRLLVNQAAEPDVVEELNALAVCQARPFVKLAGEPGVQNLESFIKLSASLANTLLQNCGDIGPDDLIVVPFSTERDVYGVAQFLARMAPNRRPRVMFLFHHPDHEWTLKISGKVVKGDQFYCRFAALEMQRVLPIERTWYCATNGALASLMSGVTGVKFEKVPIPPYYGSSDPSPSSAQQTAEEEALSPAHIGLLGGVRDEKGSQHIPAVINEFLQQRPGRPIFVQVGDAQQKAKIIKALAKSVHKDVTVWPGVLSETDFMVRMMSLDLLLLPYMWQRYVFRISSLFAEAVANGVPTIVPYRTWMARRIKDGQAAGGVFDASSPSGIVDALVEASDNVIALKESAQAKRGPWVQSQSTDALVAYLVARAQQ